MNNRLLYQYILLLISIINSDDSRLFLSLILIFMNQSSIGDIRVRREARGALNRALRSQWRPPRRPIRNFPPLCQPYQFLVEFGERKFYQSTRFNIDEFNAFFAIVRHLTPYVGHADGRLANMTTKYRVVLVLVRLATGVAFHNDGNQPYYTQTSQSLVNGTTFLNLDMIQFENNARMIIQCLFILIHLLEIRLLRTHLLYLNSRKPT